MLFDSNDDLCKIGVAQGDEALKLSDFQLLGLASLHFELDG
jgi:hypothetical protein